MYPDTFFDVCPPVQGQVVALAHSTTAARYKIPESWRGGMITVVSLGSDLYVSLGDAGVSVGADKYARSTGENIAPHWASGGICPAGASVSFPVGPSVTHMAVDSSGATGSWSAWLSSGTPRNGEVFPAALPEPALWIDFSAYSAITLSSTDIASVKGLTRERKIKGDVFSESSTRPALNSAATVGSGLTRAAASFTAGNSDKLVSTDANLASVFSGTSAWTLVMPVRRGATGALHTLFSASTSGSSNGHFDLTLDASDDIVVTRVDSSGGSDSGTYATTVNTTPVLLTLVYDGSDHDLYVNRTAQSLSATVTGDIGDVDTITLGARHINATYSQYATAEIPEVIAFDSALNAQQLNVLHSWAVRRYGL